MREANVTSCMQDGGVDNLFIGIGDVSVGFWGVERSCKLGRGSLSGKHEEMSIDLDGDRLRPIAMQRPPGTTRSSQVLRLSLSEDGGDRSRGFDL